MASPTRERILDAALELIRQQGFAGTTVTAIEDLAGLSPGSGSFYRHFHSKEDAFRALLQRELERAQQHRQDFERGAVADPHQELTRRLLQQLDYMAKVRPLIDLMAREQGRFPDLTTLIGAALVDQGIAEEAAHLMHDLPAGTAPADPHALLTVVISALTGYHLMTSYFRHSPADVDPARFAATLAALITPPPPR